MDMARHVQSTQRSLQHPGKYIVPCPDEYVES